MNLFTLFCLAVGVCYLVTRWSVPRAAPLGLPSTRGFWSVVPLTLEQAVTRLETAFALADLRYEREDGDEWFEAECPEFASLRFWRPYHRGEPEFAAPLHLVFGRLPEEVADLGQRLASALGAFVCFGEMQGSGDDRALTEHSRFEPVA